MEALKKLRNGKALATIKYHYKSQKDGRGGNTFKNICTKPWETKKIPSDWQVGFLVSTH